jgi:hypothetical protein
MKKTLATGQTCVGDWRLTPLDVGFDLLTTGHRAQPPASFSSVGIGQDGQTYLVEGTREEMLAAVKQAGYNLTAV